MTADLARDPARIAARLLIGLPMGLLTATVGAVLMGAVHTAHAADFKSIGAEPAILYDAPTLRGKRIAIAPRGMPVDPVLAENDWVRARDGSGEFFWVERKALSDKRMLLVNTPSNTVASVRTAPDDAASLVFQAKAGVLLEMLEPLKAGWVHVRHSDGQSGYVKATEVWGE